MSLGIIISLASIGLGTLYFLINLISDIIPRMNKRNWISTVPKTRLIQEIIWFSNDLLYQKQIKYFPQFKLSYYQHKRYLGLFDNKKIVIYIKNNIDIHTIVHTTLHELQHYVQSQSNLVDYKKYEAYSKSLGYDNNPLEIESREFANKWLEPCMTFLHSKGVITKEPLKQRFLKKK
jgi:Zn-dependent peptidase ImmA (M78 family)